MKISIITATFNSERTIAFALSSVLNQKSVNVESIVVDGESADNTLAIVKSFDDRIEHLVSEPDTGFYDAINKGIGLASGDIVGILNSDDYYPDKLALSKVLEAFLDPHVQAVYGDLVYVNEDADKVIRYWRAGSFNRAAFLRGWMPPHPTLFVRREVYEMFGEFKLNLGSAADYELMLRFLFKERIQAAYIPEVLTCMRIGGQSNASVLARVKANQTDRLAWEINGLKPYRFTRYLKPIRKLPQFLMRPKDQELLLNPEVIIPERSGVAR